MKESSSALPLLLHWPRFKSQWRTHGSAAIRHLIEILLCFAILMISWQLITPFLPMQQREETQEIRTSAAPDVQPKNVDTEKQSETVIQYHLFGVPVIKSQPGVEVPTSTSLKVTGILYSTAPNDSVAILDQSGKSLVAREGMLLPDGETILSIQSDRVLVNRQGTVESVVIDMKKANTNAHFTAAEFARSDNNSENPKQENNDPSELTAPALSPSTSGERPPLAVPHFKSLTQIRGKSAMQRFQKTMPPPP